LADYRRIYEREASAIDAGHGAAEEAALKTYARDLEEARKRLQSSGDLRGTLAAKEEIARFDSARTVPADEPAGLPELLRLARIAYAAGIAKARDRKKRESTVLLKQYLRLLEGLKKRLVRQDRLEEASRAEVEARRIDFILADMVLASTPHSDVPTTKRGLQNGELPQNLQVGLVLHYGFDHDDGRRVRDKSGHNQHGEAKAGAWVKKGKTGGAFQLVDGNVIELQNHSLPIGKAPRTFCAWLSFSEVSKHQAVFFWGQPRARRAFGMIAVPGSSALRAISWDDDTEFSVKMKKDKWLHVAMTYDSGTCALYIDGRPAGSARKDQWDTGEGWFLIGRTPIHPTKMALQGLIDEVTVHNRALTASEVAQLWRLQK